MIQKGYLLFFHFALGTYVAGGFFIAMSFFFKVTWAGHLQKLSRSWERLSVFVPVLYLPLVVFGRKLVPISLEEDHKLFYFSTWFITLRALLASIALWLGSRWLQKRSTVSLIIYFVTGTLIAIDWGMALEEQWDSNIYGLLYLANFGLVFFATFLFFHAQRVSAKERKDLVHVLITLMIMWGYLHYSQFIILWMGNKPSEVSFYLVRHYPWGLMSLILLVKFVPLMSLAFFPGLKMNVTVVRSISVLVVLGGWLEVVWLLAPPLQMSAVEALLTSGLLISLTSVAMIQLQRRWS